MTAGVKGNERGAANVFRFLRKPLQLAVWTLTAVSLGAASLLLYAVKAPLPAQDGVQFIPGLSEKAEVGFDKLGIPHISAANALDAYRALGFVTAQDRLFQMELLRRGPAGRLAEIFGETLLEEDRWNRVMGFGRLAGAVLDRLPRAGRQMLEAYAAGVNQAMAAARMFPIEFTLLGFRPEPWQPEDSILVLLGMHALLSWSGDQERTATVMRHTLPGAVVDFLTPQNDCFNEIVSPRNPGRCADDALPAAELAAVLREARGTEHAAGGFVSAAGTMRGSNGWAVGPAKTEGSRAILANDMHLELSVPNIWYRAVLRYPGVTLSGLTLPGFPLLISGSNGHVAWGLTSVEGDFSDLVIIEEDEGRPGMYRTPSGLLPFETRDETIRVRGGAEENLKVRTTIWGPVLPELLLGKPVAVHWTALDPAATDLGFASLAQCKSAEDALSILHRAGGPPLNVLLADREGNIAWTYMGKIPRRFGFDGLFSESWADGRKGWDGYVPPDEMPSIVNPPSGFLVNTNQRMLSSGYFAGIGHDFSGGYRAWRVSERLKALASAAESDMLEVQLDTQSDVYRYYQELALRVLGREEEAASGPFSAQELRKYLRAWDGRAETGSLGLPLLVEFREELVEAIFTPLLAKCRAAEPGFTYFWNGVDVPLQQIIGAKRDDLLPDQKSFHDWDSFLRAILSQSAKKLAKRHGLERLAGLTWGEVSKAEIRHPLAGGIPLLHRILDMPSAAIAGCGHCVRFSGGRFGASARMIVTPGREAGGILHMPGGQSGQVGSPHYSDQQESWVDGAPAEFSGGRILHQLVLEPRR
jgi:penicillin amidase